jgi:hypothetical protein
MPKGVILKRGETEAKIALTATHDASLGDFTIRVTGLPTKGTDASNDLKITVAKM